MARSPTLLPALIALLLVSPAPAGAETYFLPGQEDAVVQLLRPYSDEALVLNGWSLVHLAAGPLCAVRLGFSSGHGAEETTVTLRSGDGDPARIAFDWEPIRPADLGDALEALVQGNDPGDFFVTTCAQRTDPVGSPEGDRFPGEFSGEDGAEEAFLSMGFGGNILLRLLPRLLLVVALSALGLAVLDRRRPGAPPAPPTFRLREEPVWIKAVLLVGLGVRAVAMFYEPSYFYELQHFPATTLEEQYTALAGLAPFFDPDGLMVAGKVFHTPTLRFLLRPWHMLGNGFGIGGTVLWMRVPNLALAGWLMVLLLRAGHHLGRREAGQTAVCLFAFLPTAIDITVQMGHYLPEAVLSAWFLERLLAATRARQAVWRRVAAVGAAALWSGYITWPLVGIGALAGMIHLWRSDRRRDALAFVLAISALATPLIGTALDSGGSYDAACVPPETLATGESTVPVYEGHPIFDVSEPTPAGVLLAPWRMATYLYDRMTAVLAMVGLLLLLALRTREVRIPALVLLFYGYARTRMSLTLDQLRLLAPLMLFLPAWGWSLIPELRLPQRLRWTVRQIPWVITIVALSIGAFAPVSTPHSGRFIPSIGFYEGLGRRIGGVSLWRIREIIGADGSREIPVVANRDFRPRHVCCCHGFSTYAEMNRCMEPSLREDFPDEISFGWDGVRELVQVERIGCEAVTQLVTLPGWRTDDFFVLVPVIEGLDGTWPGCLETVGVRCALEIETQTLLLWRCGPAPDTTPEDRAIRG